MLAPEIRLIYRHSYHEKGLAERARSFPEDIIGIHRNDVAERENEGMYILHVQIVCGDSIGD
jgi:hypothetical protein